MANVTTYRCEVDLYRNGAIFRSAKEKLYDRNTTGVYLVGAKTPKEARELLQRAIGFGSITVPKLQHCQWRPEGAPTLERGQICKISRVRTRIEGTDEYRLDTYYDYNIKHATAPVQG